MVAPTVDVERTIVDPTEVLDTPCIAVDEAILRQNIAEMAALAAGHGVNLRPHMKTHKTPHIARLQLAAGAVGATCAKLGEAEIFVDQAGIDDVLLAYPVIGEPKLRRLLALMERARVTVAFDSLAAATGLSAAMAAAGRTLDLYIEVNTGQDRAGASAGEEAVALALAVDRLPGARVVGVMTHEGHAGASGPAVIAGTARNAGAALVDTAAKIRDHGIELPHVSVG
ncbi:MAG: alanine racemase, partial [Chloroflexota bacterium]|nr:alanine racemase [Chloroflexota bacterium]